MQNPTFYQGHLKKCGINKTHRTDNAKRHIKRTINKLTKGPSEQRNNNNKSKNNKNPPPK